MRKLVVWCETEQERDEIAMELAGHGYYIEPELPAGDATARTLRQDAIDFVI